MTRLLCAVLLVAFAACTAAKLGGYSGGCRSGEKCTVGDYASLASQGSAEGGSTENAVVKASSRGGRTADVQISNAIEAIARRSGIVWADYSIDQTWAACPTWGKRNITLVLYPVTYKVATNCTIPSNVTLQFSHGSCLAPADGTTTTIKGYFTAPMSKIFCNAVAGEGAVRLASVELE